MGQPASPDETTTFQELLVESTPRVIITPILLALNALVFVMMVLSGASLWDPSTEQLLNWGANFGPFTLDSEWWRLLSATFVHIGLLHLALNMQCLWSLGRLAERLFGNWRFLSLYVLSGLGGSVASVWWNPTLVSAGASGAVFGVAGGLVVFLYRGKLSIPRQITNQNLTSLLLFVGYNLVYGFARSGIDNAAHLGGLVTGVLVGALSIHSLSKSDNESRLARYVAVMGLVLLLVLGAAHARKRADAPTLNQASAAIHYNRGLDYQEQGKFDLAIEEYTQAIDLDPELFGGYINRGVAYLRKQNLLLAMADFDQAVKLDPERPEGYSNRGITLALIGQFDRALADLNKAADGYPNDAEIYFFRGMVYAEINEREKAISDLERAIKLGLDPEYRQNAENFLEMLSP